jgi:phage repressor protein C with HTH and peptisase S24 domain
MGATIGNFTDSVNGQITGRLDFPPRSFYRTMDLRKILARIERRLKVVKLSASAASKLAGKPDAIRNLKRAVKDGMRQGLNATTLAALAKVLHTTVAWLTEGTGPEDPSAAGEQTIPIWGRAGAGGKIYNFHDGVAIGTIAVPEGVNEHTAAVEILGDSLGPLFEDWCAIYDEIREPPTMDLVGKICVLEDADGQAFIKRLKKGRGKRFTLESNYGAPIYDIEVKWAAPVKSMVPK